MTLILGTLAVLGIVQGIPLYLIFTLFYFKGNREWRRKRNALVWQYVKFALKSRLARR